MGSLVGMAGPAVVGCQVFPCVEAASPLVGGAGSWGSWLPGPGGPRASACLLVGGGAPAERKEAPAERKESKLVFASTSVLVVD